MCDQKKELIATLRQLRDAAKDEKPVIQWIDRAITIAERLMAMGSRLPRIYHTNYYLIELHGGFFSSFHPQRGLFALGAELWSIVFDIEPEIAAIAGVLPVSLPACWERSTRLIHPFKFLT
jgi:hypothetical protein